MSTMDDSLLLRRRSFLGWTAALGAALLTRPALALAGPPDGPALWTAERAKWLRRQGDWTLEGNGTRWILRDCLFDKTSYESLCNSARENDYHVTFENVMVIEDVTGS